MARRWRRCKSHEMTVRVKEVGFPLLLNIILLLLGMYRRVVHLFYV